ncbi:MAG TPA: peptide-methionine (S)-S-oxide reductase MsrA [Gemmatimonadales bacterium]|jgi:peptide-methionine (S)-S-oxide reductase|nr:peptide-methionine (S)-S-oxide reductase MsrA [Gemmatimonadales bacterium]
MPTLTLAGGCFWCLETIYERLKGVEKVVSGYTGGRRANPTYEQVCSGATGHAEAIQVTYDSSVISDREMLKIFFAFHDPTTLNRQGPDVGTQYRSAIFYNSPEQEKLAREVMADLERNATFDRPIVTELKPLDVFYPAEPGHQEYYRRHPTQPYCAAVIGPKVAKLRAGYGEKLRVES